MLIRLLDLQLGPPRVSAGTSDFAGRYGFRRKPSTCGSARRSGVPSPEMTVRAGELTGPPTGVARAFILENEVTYLAFPLAPDAMAFFGDGYAVGILARLNWLAALDLTTLLAHLSRWVTEKTPTAAALGRLTLSEQALYQDLIAAPSAPPSG